ncbi:hypothetical protein R3P38DRAFT_2563739 [Favolaschia claudopus]|uniref:Uncharacterized protein n=1 Tax=Favolaschia claudopus TaxID=2862362 RepID=A0AAW0A1E7_9AGAR
MAPDYTFIHCPLTVGCPAKIPRRMTCSGNNIPWHRGLDYQRCGTCKGFRWEDPEAFAAAERRARDAPANGAPPFPPPDDPPNPWSRSPEIPHPTLDPTLLSFLPAPPGFGFGSSAAYPPASPPPPSPSQPRSQPVSTQSSIKRNCAARCSRKAGSKDCSWGMCKTCCERQRKGCRASSHRTHPAPPPAATSPSIGDPSQLTRPPPMFSTATPADSGPTEPLPPKVYKKPMGEEWARRYNATHEQREFRKTAEEQRRQQQFQYEREIRICCWMTDGEDPEFIRVQGFTMFPKLNLADHPKALEKLGLTTTSEISLYDPGSCAFHREDVDHVMEVTSHQVILARLRGVKDCPTLDDRLFIAQFGKSRVLVGGNRRSLASTSLKRKPALDSFPPSLKTAQPVQRLLHPRARPRHLHENTPFLLQSPSASSSSPFPSSSSPSLSPLSSPAVLPTPPASDPDLLWAEGKVLIPGGFGAWPDGMYVRDMARLGW